MNLSDTIVEMVSVNYVDRFIAEYKQVYIRAHKLDDLLCNWDNLDFTPKCSREILQEQLHIMYNYVSILETRAEIEKINLPTIRDFLSRGGKTMSKQITLNTVNVVFKDYTVLQVVGNDIDYVYIPGAYHTIRVKVENKLLKFKETKEYTFLEADVKEITRTYSRYEAKEV